MLGAVDCEDDEEALEEKERDGADARERKDAKREMRDLAPANEGSQSVFRSED